MGKTYRRQGSSWKHPQHAHGVRGQQIRASGAILTDKRIDEYILEGRYGTELQDQMKHRIGEKAVRVKRKAKHKKILDSI